MTRRLFNACVAAALTLGGWAGALASVVCPHAGGGARAAAPEHACCRAKARAKKQQTPAQTPAETPTQTHARRPTPRGGCHAKAHGARAAKQHAAGLQHDAPAAAAPREAAGERRVAAPRPAAPCAHCVSRPELPPAPARLREGEGARRETHATTWRAASPPPMFEPPRLPAVAVARAGPPGTNRLYVLVNRFLI